MAETTNKSDPKDTTPPKWSGPEDARSKKGAGTYPNYYTMRTRSGHVLTLDDSEENESVTLQHRGGSMVQFMPDGAVQFVSQNGQYNFVFGENRVQITGAYDVTVKGSGSLRVDKDYDCTVMGNYNMTVNGDFNLNAQNFNGQVRGDMDFNAKNFNMKVEGASTLSSHEQTNITCDGGIQLSSSSDSVAIGAAKNIGMKSGSKMMIQSLADMHIKSDSGTRMEATGGSLDFKADGTIASESAGQMSLKAGGTIAADGTNIYLNSGASQEADSADSSVVKLKKPTDPNRETA
jgi:hypothetical protein